MANLTLTDAESIGRRKRPWTIRLEFHDSSINSHKFWYATGRALDEAVECGWGRIGHKAQTLLINWGKLRDKVAEKLTKGYDWADGPFMRMTPESLAKLGGATPSAPATGVGPQGATQTPQTPSPSPPPTPTPTTPSPAAAIPPMGQPRPGMAPLPAPFDIIRAMKPLKNGDVEALDASGTLLMVLDRKGAQELAQDYGIPMMF